MAFSSGGKGVRPEINVTPLVDVVLVLLIIFMVVTPLLHRGKDVALPKAVMVDDEQKTADAIVVSITADKQLWLESDAVDENQLEAALRERLAASPGKKVLLKGDQALVFDDVRRIMKRARQAGAKSISLGVQELE